MKNGVQERAETIAEPENENGINSQQLTLTVVAGYLGVHRATISRRLRRETGETWRENLSSRMEERAKELLSDARLSVKEIAFILQFGSTSAFSRFFLKRTGVRPSKWCDKKSTENK